MAKNVYNNMTKIAKPNTFSGAFGVMVGGSSAEVLDEEFELE